MNFLGGLEDCTTWQCWAITSRVFSCADCGTHHNGCAMVKGEHLQRPSLYHGKRFADHDVSWIPWYGLLARRAFSWSLREKYQSWRKWEILRSIRNSKNVKPAISESRPCEAGNRNVPKKNPRRPWDSTRVETKLFKAGGFCEAQRYLGKLKQPFSLPFVSRFCPSKCVFLDRVTKRCACLWMCFCNKTGIYRKIIQVKFRNSYSAAVHQIEFTQGNFKTTFQFTAG